MCSDVGELVRESVGGITSATIREATLTLTHSQSHPHTHTHTHTNTHIYKEGKKDEKQEAALSVLIIVFPNEQINPITYRHFSEYIEGECHTR